MSWYDRQKLTLREIQNVSLLSCFNPTAGSFKIDPRLQRQYSTFAVQMPSAENLIIIYKSIFMGHVTNFDPDVQTFADRIVTASLELHKHVTAYFLPTAIKFHYQFNLRQLASVFEGLTRSKRDYFTQPLTLARLWVNEVERVYMDRLTSEADMTRFNEMIVDVCKKNMDNCGFTFDKLYARPIQFTTFASPSTGVEAPPYMEAQDAAKVKKSIEDKLFEYNETNAVMNIVLFDQAIEHVCRICRIIDIPRGNALLVGVGGSGKQSLARLSAFICGYERFQITITNNYTLADFKLDLVTIYQKAGIKNIGICFIFVDGQIVNEKMLVFMNDMLASGKIADLFTPEERDEL
jgi:dynein heavy chain